MKALAFIRQPSFAKYIMADLAMAFREIGWNVHWLDLEHRVRETLPSGPEGIQALIEEIQRDTASFDPGLILSYGVEYLCDGTRVFGPPFTQPLHALLERPCVHFFFDFDRPFDGKDPADMDAEFLRRIQGPGFLFFCWDREALARMKALGLIKSFYFPMAVNPKAFHRIDPASPELDSYRSNIVFAGGPTPERIAHLECLSDLGLSVYGYGEDEWKSNPALAPCWHPPIADRETLNLCYNAARISVNITRPHGFTSLNMRVYEAMAAGSLMLTDEKSDARRLFEVGEEMVIYHSLDDLREKVRWFLEHESERVRIAESGRRRVLRDHTYDARARDAAPVIEQFYREHLLFRRIEAMAETRPAHAFQLLKQDALADAIRLHMDHYAFCLGDLARRNGDTSLARRYAQAALDANSGHLEARRLLETVSRPGGPADSSRFHSPV